MAQPITLSAAPPADVPLHALPAWTLAVVTAYGGGLFDRRGEVVLVTPARYLFGVAGSRHRPNVHCKGALAPGAYELETRARPLRPGEEVVFRPG